MLDGGAGTGKEMFDKGELAAILRFGAENLFEEERNEQAKQEVQQRDEQLFNEDIDEILARAEVVDQRVQVRNCAFPGGLRSGSFWRFCTTSLTRVWRVQRPSNSGCRCAVTWEG